MYIYNNLQQELIKYGNIQSLMRYFSVEALKDKHRTLVRNKATGIDGITKQQYEADLDLNVQNLVKRLKEHSYFPKPSLKHSIPKGNGELREIGIPAYEDKLVQGIMSDILVSTYEPIFLDCSYGYRPNRNCHSALLKLNQVIYKETTKYILETDITGFFDNINHKKLIEMLSYTIKDKNFLIYIKRFLNAGYISKYGFIRSDKGFPQGGLISPVLANIYLHYALDSFYTNNIKRIFPHSELIRYCDDFIISCDSYKSASSILDSIRNRLSEFFLELKSEKTRIIPFGITCNKSDNFKFLGFELNIRNNNCLFTTYISKTIQKQEHIKMLILQKLPFENLVVHLNNYLNGLYQYYSISTNMNWVQDIYLFTIHSLYRILCCENRVYSFMTLNEMLEKYPICKPPSEPKIVL